MSAVTARSDAKRPARAPRTRSSIGNGCSLPNVDGRSAWARYFREVTEAMEAHVGGAGKQTEPERMLTRRVAALEAELVSMEVRFATLRAAGSEPSERDLDLYGRLANGQRRHLEALGIQRRPRDLVPDLRSYVEGQAA